MMILFFKIHSETLGRNAYVVLQISNLISRNKLSQNGNHDNLTWIVQESLVFFLSGTKNSYRHIIGYHSPISINLKF